MYFDLTYYSIIILPSSLFSLAVLTKKQRCFLAHNTREDADAEIGILANFYLHVTLFFCFSFNREKLVQSLVEAVADRKKRGKKPEEICFDSYRQWPLL